MDEGLVLSPPLQNVSRTKRDKQGFPKADLFQTKQNKRAHNVLKISYMPTYRPHNVEGGHHWVCGSFFCHVYSFFVGHNHFDLWGLVTPPGVRFFSKALVTRTGSLWSVISFPLSANSRGVSLRRIFFYKHVASREGIFTIFGNSTSQVFFGILPPMKKGSPND